VGLHGDANLPNVVLTIRFTSRFARWSNSELGIRDVMGSVSIDDSIKAARVVARLGE